MPFAYTVATAMQAATYGTSTATNTTIDVMSLKPGTRNMSIYNIRGQGRGAGLTALSGISLEVIQWTTGSTNGVTLTPQPADAQSQAAKSTVLIGGGSSLPVQSGVNSGSGGPTYRGGFGFGASGPGGWVAANPDAVLLQPGSATASYDIESISGTASLAWEGWCEFSE
jgi:hypothetical protein